MPNIKSSIKRVKVNEKKKMRNRMIKTGVKTAVKKFNLVLTKDPANGLVALSAVSSSLDKAAVKGAIHKNAVNRKKSRLAKALNKATA